MIYNICLLATLWTLLAASGLNSSIALEAGDRMKEGLENVGWAGR